MIQPNFQNNIIDIPTSRLVEGIKYELDTENPAWRTAAPWQQGSWGLICENRNFRNPAASSRQRGFCFLRRLLRLKVSKANNKTT
jgi:hypothetical protein